MENSDNSPATASQEQQYHACAACKHQRKKCEPSCVFRPYFPPKNHDQFMKVHKVFGVSNMQKMIKTIQEGPPEDWQKAVRSLVWEAERRDQDPMFGSWGENKKLWEEVKTLKRENEILRRACKTAKYSCLCNYRQHGNNFFSNNAVNPAYELFVPEPVPYASSSAPNLHDQAQVDPLNEYYQNQPPLPVTGQLQQNLTSTDVRGQSNLPDGSWNGQFESWQ